VERIEIIEALKRLRERVEAEIEGLPDAALRYRPAEGEWSIKEVVGHLRDMAEVWHTRLYMVSSQTDPLFLSFDGEASVIDHAYQDADLRSQIETMAEWRLKTIDLLSHAVDWTRLGQQRGVGRRSFKYFAEFVLSHDDDHLDQIRANKAAQGIAVA
jgi:hypothetical protein